MDARRRTWGLGLAAVGLTAVAGCQLGPRAFFDQTNPAPLVRARAVTMGDRHADEVVVPALLDRLDDPDPVVRLTADEELRRRTGQDFGFRAWEEPIERGRAAARWRAWWAGVRANAS